MLLALVWSPSFLLGHDGTLGLRKESRHETGQVETDPSEGKGGFSCLLPFFRDPCPWFLFGLFANTRISGPSLPLFSFNSSFRAAVEAIPPSAIFHSLLSPGIRIYTRSTLNKQAVRIDFRTITTNTAPPTTTTTRSSPLNHPTTRSIITMKFTSVVAVVATVMATVAVAAPAPQATVKPDCGPSGWKGPCKLASSNLSRENRS